MRRNKIIGTLMLEYYVGTLQKKLKSDKIT